MSGVKKTDERIRITKALLIYSKLCIPAAYNDPFELAERIKGISGKNKELALDLWTLHECLLVWRITKKTDILKTLNEIYFKPKLSRPYAKEISSRILRYALDNYCDVRTVYRRLEEARKTFFLIRRIYAKNKKD